MYPDIINGTFELSAGLLLWLNVYRLHKDKQVHGIHIVPTVLFAVWGYWNIFFYSHLEQWASFAGGIMLVLANTTWVVQMIYYGRKIKEIKLV